MMRRIRTDLFSPYPRWSVVSASSAFHYPEHWNENRHRGNPPHAVPVRAWRPSCGNN